MKKILKSLLVYMLVIVSVLIIFSLFNRGEEMFSMYNIMNGLAYGGLVVIVFCGFLGKKGDKIAPVTPGQVSAGINSGLTPNLGAVVTNLAYTGDPKLMMQSEKPHLEPRKTYIDAPKKEDSRLLKVILFALPYIVGIGCIAVGVIYLIG